MGNNTGKIDSASAYRTIRALFSDKIKVAVLSETASIEELYPEERVLVTHAAKKRQGEFAAGRLCAKRALAELGIAGFPILMDEKRAPIWPEGVSGSISHAKGCTAAVVGRVQDAKAIGLDIEKINRIEEDIWEYTFVESEISWLREQGSEMQKWASLMFSAKEAFYKAQYPLTHMWLGFKDVRVAVDKTSREFNVQTLIPLENWVKKDLFKGRYGFFESYVVTGILVEPK